MSIQFSSIWPVDRALLGDTTPTQNGPGNDDNEGVLYNSLSSSIIGALLSDSLVIAGIIDGEVLTPRRAVVGVFSPPQLTGPFFTLYNNL